MSISPKIWFRENIKECYDFLSNPATLNKLSQLIQLNKYCLMHLIKQLDVYSPVHAPFAMGLNAEPVISSSPSQYDGVTLPDYDRPLEPTLSAGNSSSDFSKAFSAEYNPEKEKKEKEQIAINEFNVYSPALSPLAHNPGSLMEENSSTRLKFNNLKKDYDSLYVNQPPQSAIVAEKTEKPSLDEMTSLLKMQEDMRRKDADYQLPPPNLNADEFKRKTEEYFSTATEKNGKTKDERIDMLMSILELGR